jgi:hypothetical protein
MQLALCRHGRKMCSDCYIADDAAKRAYGIARQVAHNLDFEARTKGFPWLAFRLSDGSSDGISYATKREAIQHQLHEYLCAYFSFRNSPNGFSSPKDAGLYLAWHRAAYDAGFRLPDPDDKSGGPELIMPDAREHLDNQFGRLN